MCYGVTDMDGYGIGTNCGRCVKFGTCEKKEKPELFCADFAAIAAVDAWEFRLPEMEQHL